MTLSGKVAIITGAAQGIGLAIARDLAGQGARLAIFDLNEAKARTAAAALEQEFSGCQAIGGLVDVASLDSVQAMIAAVVGHYSCLDIAINNAGILSATPVQEISEAEWDRVLAINLKGTFFVAQQVYPHLLGRPHPRIINIASIAGRMGGFESGMAYTASKGGVIALTQGLSRHYAAAGITVNCVCPGTTESPMIKLYTPEQIASLTARIPLGKLIKPEGIGSAVAFLASDEADFITGVSLDVNGGMYVG